MSQLVPTGDRTGRCLNPNRVSIWPVETGGDGIDFTYHGATGYTDAEFAEQILQAGGLETSFRQELDGAWTVPLRPAPARPHARGARSFRLVAGRQAGHLCPAGASSRAARGRPRTALAAAS